MNEFNGTTCPICEGEIAWQSGGTACGLEAHIPHCTECEWEGEPE